LSVSVAAGNTALVDIDRSGASEMVPQPGAIDNSAAVIIHARIRNSKQDTWVGEIDDLVNEHCMTHRETSSAMTMPWNHAWTPAAGEAQKPAIVRIK
jgi:hypothetical protein